VRVPRTRNGNERFFQESLDPRNVRPAQSGDTPDASRRTAWRPRSPGSQRTAPRPRRRQGAWCGSHVATQLRLGATPAEALRRSRGSECQHVVLRRGSRRRARRGLHRSIATSWLSQATRTVDLRSPGVAFRSPEEANPWRRHGDAGFVEHDGRRRVNASQHKGPASQQRRYRQIVDQNLCTLFRNVCDRDAPDSTLERRTLAIQVQVTRPFIFFYIFFDRSFGTDDFA
jgi:hypothetical protein